MQATISSKGQLVIPEALREQARLRQGDKVDLGFADGLIVMRKRQPLTASRVRALLSRSRRLPPSTPKDEEIVTKMVRESRAARRASRV